MMIDASGTVTTFADLPSGALFRFGLHGDRFIGLKVSQGYAGDAPASLCVVLAPGHPGYDKPQPGLYAAQVIGDYPVFHMPTVQFVVSQNANCWFMGGGHNVEAGDVLLTASRVMLVVASNHQLARVDLNSGEIVSQLRELPIVVKAWSLVMLQFDDPRVLFARGA